MTDNCHCCSNPVPLHFSTMLCTPCLNAFRTSGRGSLYCRLHFNFFGAKEMQNVERVKPFPPSVGGG